MAEWPNNGNMSQNVTVLLLVHETIKYSLLLRELSDGSLGEATKRQPWQSGLKNEGKNDEKISEPCV